MKSPKIRFLLRALLSGGLIVFLLSRLTWTEVGGLLRGADRLPLAGGFLLAIVGQFLMAERTRLMLDHWEVRLSRGSAAAVTWIGQFCNNFLPGGMGGDMVKFYRVGRLYPHARAATLVALIADRVLALAALVVISTVVLLLGDHEMLRVLFRGSAFGHWQAYIPTWWIAALLALGSATFLTLLTWRYRRAIVAGGAAHLRKIRAAVQLGRRPDAKVAAALGLAILVHTIGIVAGWYFARGLAIPLTLGQMFLIWPVVLVAMMMPLSVNGHGLREFILIYYFERWHLTSHLAGGAGVKESVVALSLLVVLSDLLCNLPGGLLLLTWNPAPGKAPPTPPGV